MIALPLERSAATPAAGPSSHGATPGGGAAGTARPPLEVWGPALAVLGFGLALLLGVLFRTEVVTAVAIWDSSTAYNHCWLVLPVALWLAWTRRDRLAGLAPAPMPAAALLAAAATLAWFAAERLGIMEGRQFALLGLMWSLFLGVLGWRVCRAMAGPLAYLIFLVPFGEFLTPRLQDVTAWIVDLLLSLSGIPHFVDHLIIEIPEGTFLVAEACAGLRFLIAAIAFGALYALVMFRSPGRRLIVLVLSVVVPIIANGIRAFGIVLMGHLLGSAEAGAADHVIYGWVFFSVVILLLILLGLPFREDLEDAPRPAPPPEAGRAPRPVALALTAALLLVLAAAGPAAAAGLEGGWEAVTEPEITPLALQAPEDCVPDGRTLRCGPADAAMRISARLLALPPRASWSAVGTARLQALGPVEEADTRFTTVAPGQGIWQGVLRRDAGAPRAAAVAVWIDGAPSGGGLRSRLEQAVNSLRGDPGVPVLLVLEVAGTPDAFTRETGSRREGELLQRVLAEQGAALSAEAAGRSGR